MRTNIPTLITAPLCLALGAAGSSFAFVKLSNVAQYAINKKFGDYNNLFKTSPPSAALSDKIIVTAGTSKDYFYIQNGLLGAVVATISSKLVQILCSSVPRSTNATSALIGGVAAPALWALYQIYGRSQGSIPAIWVALTPKEIAARNINLQDITILTTNKIVIFGSSSVLIEGAQRT